MDFTANFISISGQLGRQPGKLGHYPKMGWPKTVAGKGFDGRAAFS
jgi:hypothetical protein